MKHLKLLSTTCKIKTRTLSQELTIEKLLLEQSCSPEAFIFYNTRLEFMANSLKSLLKNRRTNKNFRRNLPSNNAHALPYNDNLVSAVNTCVNTNAHPSPSPRTDLQQANNNRRRRRRRITRSITLENSSVINLSRTPLSNEEISVLSRGLTFCPTPHKINWSQINADIYDFQRRMRLAEYFYNDESTSNNSNQLSFTNTINPFRNKSSWTPPIGRDRSLDTFLNAVKLNIHNSTLNRTRDNLTSDERDAITSLKSRQDIIIKPADKGSGTVVMDRDWYVNECNRQLNDAKFYRHLDADITNDIAKRVTVYKDKMNADGHIDDETKSYLKPHQPTPGRFYILHKIHKTGNPGRPIVSSNSHPTEHISEFVDFHIKPLVIKLPSYVKDTNHFLNILLTLPDLPANSLLVTLDVSGLYTNIPHNEGIDACYHFLSTRNTPSIPACTICDLICMILTMNNFSFNDKHYLQIHGTAMGTRMAPSFANLFLGLFETNALQNAPFKPYIWLRYIDDVFVIWTEGIDNLETFINYLNNLHPTIKFTSSHSYDCVPFS